MEPADIGPTPRRRGGLELEFNTVAKDSINHTYITEVQSKLWTQELIKLP